jgi:hypothetical protein
MRNPVIPREGAMWYIDEMMRENGARRIVGIGGLEPQFRQADDFVSAFYHASSLQASCRQALASIQSACRKFKVDLSTLVLRQYGNMSNEVNNENGFWTIELRIRSGRRQAGGRTQAG